MKWYGFATFIVLLTVGLIMAGCSEQKPAEEKASPERARVENLATTPEDIKKEARDQRPGGNNYGLY
jgi:hypothetical protein